MCPQIGVGMTFLHWNGTQARLVVTEPELIKEILNNKEKKYVKIVFQEFIQRLLGHGLVLSIGKKWLKMCKLANHAFHAESFRVSLVYVVEFAVKVSVKHTTVLKLTLIFETELKIMSL